MSTVTQPPATATCLLSYPAPFVLLVTINRAKQMNSIPFKGHWELHSIFGWFDAEPNLRVAVITGAGTKSFCAGQDLIELGKLGAKETTEPWLLRHPASGFAGISRRTGKKPVIAAVNGYALGGGFEIVLNCDMVVASPTASFGLPEALRGIYAAAGGLPRLASIVGLPIASEIALTARRIDAKEAKELRLINVIAKTQESTIAEAVALAEKIGDLSPDAVIVTRAGLREIWKTADVEQAAIAVEERYKAALYDSPNKNEGLAAFAEKRKPKWVPSKM